MAKQLQKLELTWIGKGNEPQLEPRILIEDPKKSFGDNRSENMLIHGDNLLALKALEQQYAGKVKCIYIDPPYNTGNAFEHYDDGIEHSIWMNLMKPRLEILRNLLSDNGSIWISIDENEGHYLKVMCDEIFGRRNYIIQTVIQRGGVTGHKAINPSPVQVSDLMIAYAKNKEKWVYQPVYRAREFDEAYSKFIINFDESFEKWKFITLNEALSNLNLSLKKLLEKYPDRIIRFAQPSYDSVGQATRDLIDISKADDTKVYLLKREGNPNIYLWKGERILFYKDKMKFIDGTLVTAELVTNIWTDMKYQGIAKEGNVTFAKSKKPEAQIRRILEMTTCEGDIILDSFLGSGTTAAVAHKMKRKWIGIELGEHANTLCHPRLISVVSGKDKSGISENVNWKGGGGFKFYTLAPSLLLKDKYGSEVVNPEYNPNMLAAAMAKQEGFRYSPDQSIYWKQGSSSEKDFIYTTTQFVTVEMLDRLSEEMQPGESLLVCCKSYAKGCVNRHANVTIKKIPQMLLGRCEFGRDDYSLNIVNMPNDNENESDQEIDSSTIEVDSNKTKKKSKKESSDTQQSSLF